MEGLVIVSFVRVVSFGKKRKIIIIKNKPKLLLQTPPYSTQGYPTTPTPTPTLTDSYTLPRGVTQP